MLMQLIVIWVKMTASSQTNKNYLTLKKKSSPFRAALLPTATVSKMVPWHPDPVTWLESHFYIPETNKPIVLHPYIKSALREATRRDEGGRFIYSLVVWSDIKKSGKSCIAAGIALWMAHRPGAYGTVRLIANDKEQAESRVNFYLTRAIDLHPTMKTYIRTIQYRKILPDKTEIKAVPIDPKGEAGGNDDLIVYSELWGWSGDKADQMWSETTLPPNKFGYSLQWVESYAGYIGKSTILYDLYQKATDPAKGGQPVALPDCPELEVFSNPKMRMFCLWNSQPRLDWQTAEYYQVEEGKLNPGEYARIHQNKWAASTEAFVQPENWAACHTDYARLAVGDDRPVVVAIDGAVTRDNFAILGITRVGNKVQVQFCKIWKPTKGRKEIDYSQPELYLRRLVRAARPATEEEDGYEDPLPGFDLNVVCFCYDPFQLVSTAQRLRADGTGHFFAFNQNGPRLEADSQLQQMILARQVQHPDNELLNQHIKNSFSKIEGENKLRLVKGDDSTKKIDLAVCLAMAVHKAMRLPIG